MNIIKKTAAVSAALCVCACVTFTSCSDKTETAEVNKPLSDEEINSKYAEIFNNSDAEEILSTDYNPIADNFTTADFQFTDLADEVAFNLSENSFAEITPTCTNFNFFDSSIQGEVFEGAFKTAKGLSLSNTLAEHAAAYKISEYGALALTEDAEGIMYADCYNTAEVFGSRITIGFSSADGIEYCAITPEELRNILSLKDSSGVVTDDIISQIVQGYQTVAIVDLYPDANMNLSKLTISRFDKKAE